MKHPLLSYFGGSGCFFLYKEGFLLTLVYEYHHRVVRSLLTNNTKKDVSSSEETPY
jgi:hypothetical protein